MQLQTLALDAASLLLVSLTVGDVVLNHPVDPIDGDLHLAVVLLSLHELGAKLFENLEEGLLS